MPNRMYIILPMSGGSPVTNNLTYVGHVLIEQYKTSGLYMVTGKEAELDAIIALSNATVITKLTDTKVDDVKPIDPIDPKPVDPKVEDPIDVKKTLTSAWAELDSKPEKAIVDKINVITAAEVTSKPVITDKDSAKDIILKMVKNKEFERDYWVKYE